jgi:hypothetical protein
MFVRAIGYIVLPIVVIGAAAVLGYLIPARLFPHWSADAHATVAMAVVPVAAIAVLWLAIARAQRRGRDDFSPPE